MGLTACITSATAMKSQAPVSTQEGLRAEVAAAVAGEEVGLSLSLVLGMTLFHPKDFAHRNPIPAHSILSSLCAANWAASVFLFLSQEKKSGFFYTGEKLNTHAWEQRAKEQYWCAAFSSRMVPTCFRTDSSLDSHHAHTCPSNVPSPCHIRTFLCNTGMKLQ